jgi:hypothetical protein
MLLAFLKKSRAVDQTQGQPVSSRSVTVIDTGTETFLENRVRQHWTEEQQQTVIQVLLPSDGALANRSPSLPSTGGPHFTDASPHPELFWHILEHPLALPG